jgi:hypothetical protein
MKWFIKIEGKDDQRIMITLDPLKELLTFSGVWKSPKMEWIVFSEETNPMSIDLETIQDIMYRVYTQMRTRIDIYNDLKATFKEIGTIEIKDDE